MLSHGLTASKDTRKAGRRGIWALLQTNRIGCSAKSYSHPGQTHPSSDWLVPGSGWVPRSEADCSWPLWGGRLVVDTGREPTGLMTRLLVPSSWQAVGPSYQCSAPVGSTLRGLGAPGAPWGPGMVWGPPLLSATFDRNPDCLAIISARP